MAAWRFLWGYQRSLAMMWKNFHLFCWLSWWFAIVKRFIFINYGWPLMFCLVHRLELKWPETLFRQTSSHCRNYLYSKKKIFLHLINICLLWQILLVFYPMFNYASIFLTEISSFFCCCFLEWEHTDHTQAIDLYWCRAIMIILFSLSKYPWKP